MRISNFSIERCPGIAIPNPNTIQIPPSITATATVEFSIDRFMEMVNEFDEDVALSVLADEFKVNLKNILKNP